MRRHLRAQAGEFDGTGKPVIDLADAFAPVLDDELLRDRILPTISGPTAHMCEETRRQANWRLTLVGLSAALLPAIKYPLLEVDVPRPFAHLQRS